MSNTQPVSISLRGMTKLPAVGPFHPLVLDTTDGIIESRLYEADNAKAAILWLGEAEGEFPSPADGLYERQAERYQSFGVASLRLQYRNPAEFAGLSHDLLVGAFVHHQRHTVQRTDSAVVHDDVTHLQQHRACVGVRRVRHRVPPDMRR